MEKILSLDLGSTTGWAFVEHGKLAWYNHFTEKEGYRGWGKKIKEIIDLWKPDIIVCSQTNSFGHYNSTRTMFMRFGIACYIAEGFDLPVVELNDSQARKTLFGVLKKNPEKKPKHVAHDHLAVMLPETKELTEDEKDAIILGLAWYKLNKE